MSKCIEAAGYRDKDGYGAVVREGRRLRAHRVAYAENVGPIPDGYVIHHTCENRGCVNPEHLQAMTRTEHQRLHGSMYVASAARVAQSLARTECNRGHAYAEHGYYWRGKRYCSECQRMMRALRTAA